jgi:preprotein translocase subunit SecG
VHSGRENILAETNIYRHNVATKKRRPEASVVVYLDISLIITSIALIASVILQSKGAGLGGLTGADTGGIFTARRGIEKTLFRVTIGLSILFFILAFVTVLVVG